MAKGETRDPVTHRTPSQIKKHSRTYQQRPDQMKYRRDLAKLRYDMDKKGVDRDGKDVSHVVAHKDGGSVTAKNTRLVGKSANRGHGTTRGNGRKKRAASLIRKSRKRRKKA